MTLEEVVQYITEMLNKNKQQLKNQFMLGTSEICLLSGRIQEAEKILNLLKTVRTL